MTALAMEGDRERGIDAGMDDYISKPVKSKAIYEVLLKYCSTSEKTARPEADRSVKHDHVREADDETLLILDPAQLLDISDKDEEIILELIEAFLKDAPVYFEDLVKAVDSGDQDAIGKKAHRLNGLAANMGADRLLKSGRKIENAVVLGSFESGHFDIHALKNDLNAVNQALKEMDWTDLCD